MTTKIYSKVDLLQKLQDMAIDYLKKHDMMLARGSYSEADIVLQTKKDFAMDRGYSDDNVYFRLEGVNGSGNYNSKDIRFSVFNDIWDNETKKYNKKYIANESKVYYLIDNRCWSKEVYTTDKKFAEHVKAIRHARYELKKAVEDRNKHAETEKKITNKEFAKKIKERIEKETGKKIKDQIFTVDKYTYDSGKTQYHIDYIYRNERKCLFLG